MDKFLGIATEPETDSIPKANNTIGVANRQKPVNRKCNAEYIRYGFTWCDNEKAPKPQFVVCGEELANHAMVPSKLIRHLKTKHASYANKDKEFFQRMLSQNKIQKRLMKLSFTVSEKPLAASYHFAKLIAQQKKTHAIAEKLLKPSCLEIVRLMLGKKEVHEIKKVSLSAETIKRRIDDMSSDILETLINKLKTSGYFSLQIDETTDITKKAQLLSVVRFVDGDSMKEEYLFCEELPKRTTGQEIFRVTHEFFTAHGIDWNNCLNVCTDGASAMVGEGRGFAALVKRQNPAIEITHCCIHREALMVKVLPTELSETMNDCYRVVNFIKARALNSRIFSLLCKEMGSQLCCIVYMLHY